LGSVMEIVWSFVSRVNQHQVKLSMECDVNRLDFT